jgi:hypothetical protein
MTGITIPLSGASSRTTHATGWLNPPTTGHGRFASLLPVFPLWDALSGLPHEVDP